MLAPAVELLVGVSAGESPGLEIVQSTGCVCVENAIAIARIYFDVFQRSD